MRATSSIILGDIARVTLVGTRENIAASIVGTHDGGNTREELVEAGIGFGGKSSVHTKMSEAQGQGKEYSLHTVVICIRGEDKVKYYE